MMDIKCKGCGGEISAENINFRQVTASCPTCHISFNIAKQLGAFDSAESPPIPHSAQPHNSLKPRRPIARPANIEVDKWDNQLLITHPYYGFSKFGLAFITIFWCGLIGFHYYLSLTEMRVGAEMLLSLIFPIFHVLFGMSLLGTAIQAFVNSTVIHIEHDHLYQHHVPISVPWVKRVDVPIADIVQLFCVKQVSVDADGDSHTKYELYISRKKGKDMLLWSNKDYMPLLFIEQEIEEFLGIQDQLVVGGMWIGKELS